MCAARFLWPIALSVALSAVWNWKLSAVILSASLPNGGYGDAGVGRDNSLHLPSTTHSSCSDHSKHEAWSQLASLPRYEESPANGQESTLCSWLPANRTASFLWTRAMTALEESRLIDAAARRQEPKNRVGGILQEMLHDHTSRDKLWWNPQAMATSWKGHPPWQVWGHVVEKLGRRMAFLEGSTSSQSTNPTGEVPPPVQVWILVPPTATANHEATKCRWPPDKHGVADKPVLTACRWYDLLEGLLEELLLPTMRHEKHDSSFTKLVQVTVHSSPTATSDVYTQALRYYGLLGDNNDHNQQRPDLILHALQGLEMTRNPPTADIVATVDFAHALRHRLQHFVRASLESQPCAAQPPVLLIVETANDEDDDVSRGRSFLEDTLFARVVRQLADHYQLGFISHSQVVQRQRWMDLEASSSSSSSVQEAMAADTTGILATLLFSMLHYTVDYCGEKSSRLSELSSSSSGGQAFSPLISPETVQRVSTVLPPYLDGDLSLINVSEKWKKEEARQRSRRARVCRLSSSGNVTDNGESEQGSDVDPVPFPSCLLAWGPPKSVTELRAELAAVQTSSFPIASLASSSDTPTSKGKWEFLESGILRATGANAELSLTFKNHHGNRKSEPTLGKSSPTLDAPYQPSLEIALFAVAPIEGDDGATEDRPVSLQWTVRMGKATRTRRVNVTQARVAEPNIWTVQLPAVPFTTTESQRPGGELGIRLGLIQGNGVDIAALYICHPEGQ